jgi:transcriptional regulator GlxA family with amidase domain
MACIKNQSRTPKYIASNCTDTYLLGKSGVIDGRWVTTYPGGEDELQAANPKAPVQMVRMWWLMGT